MVVYIRYTIHCPEPVREALIAELAEVQFEAFTEIENGLEAYVQESEYNPESIPTIMQQYAISDEQIRIERIEPENWNEQWESNFEPVELDQSIRIRAPFHQPDPRFKTELIIQPKNTFGTGHHETTCNMLALMESVQFQHKTVLDFGTGTGILAIQAKLKGAENIDAIDIDPWCLDNVLENEELNGVAGIHVACSDLPSFVSQHLYDIVLANINRNILLDNFAALHARMKPQSEMLISGFYASDLPVLQEALSHFGFDCKQQLVRNNWCGAHFQRKSHIHSS